MFVMSLMKPGSITITHLFFIGRSYENPKEIRSGGFRQVLNYTPYWRKHGVHFHVIMPSKDPTSPKEEEIDGVCWHYYAKGSQLGEGSHGHDESLKFALSTIRSRQFEPAAHALLMPTDLTITSARLLKEAVKDRIASVMPVHMFPVLTRRFSLRDRVRVWRERRLYAPVTAMHANSEASGQAMATLANKPISWAKVILTGVDLTRFRPPETEDLKIDLRKKLGLPADRLIVLFVGGATARKGVDFLVDAWETALHEHPLKATLIMVGGDANRPGVAPSARPDYQLFADRFSQRLATLDPALDVRLLPHSPTVEDYYRAADIFVFPSLHEGLPNAVLEAMACGLPVLSTRFLGFPNEGGEFGYEGQHFLSLPRDAAAWSSALASIAGDPARRTSMGAAARRWMECYQDLRSVTGQSAEFFHGLARSLHDAPPSK